MAWIRTPLSQSIFGFGYDRAKQTLTIKYRSDETYDYFDVPEDVFEDMKEAPSKGHFITDKVKGVYRFARV